MSYNSFNNAMRKRFGGKVYRLSLSTGCTCPNRDGKCGTGGCIFCSEGGSGEFAQSSVLPMDVQIERAKELVAGKISTDPAGYIIVYDTVNKKWSDYDEIGKMSWIDEDDSQFYQMSNFISVTAGDYDGDNKETVVVYAALDYGRASQASSPVNTDLLCHLCLLPRCHCAA